MRKSAPLQRPGAGNRLLLDLLCVMGLATGLLGCGTVDNPAACSEADRSCPGAMTCNVDTRLCEMPSINPDMRDARPDGAGDAPMGDGGDDSPGSDGGSEDAPEPTDAGTDLGTDVGVEAPGSCASDEHCTTAGSKHCVAGRCAACDVNDHCTEDRPWCSPTKTCETCKAAMDVGQNVCAGKPRPFCDPASARCSECLTSVDCKDPMKPTCAAATKTCTPCNQGGGDPECKVKNVALPRCSAKGDVCVECSNSLDCTKPGLPICVDERCVPCTRDRECVTRGGDNPGLCLVRAGRCARADEVVYVKNDPGTCTTEATGGGTVEKPVCTPALGLARTTATRNVLLLRGPDVLDRLHITGGSGPLFVFGQEGATIFPGAARGIELTAARDVYVQSVTVSGGAAEGAVVEGEGTLRLNRCTLKENAKGGLVARGGAGYEISNSVFAGNGPGILGPINFGGALLGPTTGGRQAIFRYNTVVSNMAPGVVCESDTQVLYGVLFYGNQLAEKQNCDAPGSLEAMDPLFSGLPYHLSGSSPCKDRGHVANFPVDDIDGDKRPAGDRSDCGADEFIGP